MNTQNEDGSRRSWSNLVNILFYFTKIKSKKSIPVNDKKLNVTESARIIHKTIQNLWSKYPNHTPGQLADALFDELRSLNVTEYKYGNK